MSDLNVRVEDLPGFDKEMFARPDSEKCPEMLEWEAWIRKKDREQLVVRQIKGSSAGASSSSFHSYRNMRRNEDARVGLMDRAYKAQAALDEKRKRNASIAAEEDEQMAKRRAKRQRQKERKRQGKKGIAVSSSSSTSTAAVADKISKTRDNDDNGGSDDDDDDEDDDGATASPAKKLKSKADPAAAAKAVQSPGFANDGSFMEMFMKKQEEMAAKVAGGASPQ